MGRKWTNEMRDEARARLARGESIKAVAEAMGVHRNTVEVVRRLMVASAGAPSPAAAPPPPPAAPPPPEPDRLEVRDAAFWRGKFNSLERHVADVEHLAAELAGLTGRPSLPAAWLLPPPDLERRKAVLVCLLSDVHAGEVIAPEEMDGLGEYNLEVCKRRLRRYFRAAVEVGGRWASDCQVQGVLVALAGDLISGDIHEELRQTNALTSHEQVLFVVEEIAAGLRHLADAFGLVHVVSVPGNHGRLTQKETAKLYARANYDTLAARMIADRLAGDKRVSFQISASFDSVVPVLGHTVFVTHGHKMGTGGGMGFAGPMLPIVRGAKKVEAQQARANRRPDLILHGHYHTSGNPGGILSNGSVPGYSEYGKGLRAALEPPQQWLALIHERWGLRDRCEIKLEDPAPPPLPVMRIPAVMERR